MKDLKDLTLTVKLDSEIKEKLCKEIDSIVKEMKEFKIKTNQEMIERNKKIMEFLEYEDKCLQRLIALELGRNN